MTMQHVTPGSAAGLPTLVGNTSIGATTIVISAVTADVYVGRLIGIDAGTTNCEIRRIKTISGTTLTLSSALKAAHISGVNVWTTGFWVPLEYWGAKADGDDASPTDSYRAVINANLDYAANLFGIHGSGKANYAISRPIFFSDYTYIDASFRAYSTFAIDCTVGKWGTIPNQYLATLAGQKVTVTFDSSTDNITLAPSSVGIAGSDIIFYPRPGSTMPGGIEEGRRYFTLTNGLITQVEVSQGSGTHVDITSNGSGEIIAVSSGLARLIGRLGLHGGKTKALNGLYANFQQPSELTARIEQFPVIGATISADQGLMPNIEVINCWTGIECAGAQMMWFPYGNVENCDINVSIADNTRWQAPGSMTNQQIAFDHFHFEGTGSGNSQIQTLKPSATLTGGAFQLRFKNVLTGSIAYNTTAAALQATLEAHSAIGGGNVICTQVTGTDLSNGMIQCDFTLGSLAWEQWVGSTSTATGGQMAVVSSTVTGGTVSVNLINPGGQNVLLNRGNGVSIENSYFGSFTTKPDGTRAALLKTTGTALDATLGPQQGYVLRSVSTAASGMTYIDDALFSVLLVSDDTTGSGQYVSYFERASRHGGAGNPTARQWAFTGGGGGLFVGNAGNAPQTPTNGGVIYVSGGSLKYKGSGGSITTLGAA